MLRLRDQLVGIIAAVGEYGLGLAVAQQLCRRRVLAGLPGGEAEL